MLQENPSSFEFRGAQDASLDSRFKTRAMPIIMGIVNVTPDSFSDGGEFYTPEKAIEHALRLEAEGADVLDIGAESTRPGAAPIGADEEWRRLAPVLSVLVHKTKARISIDTYRVETARRAIDSGATLINDVWAGRYDEAQGVGGAGTTNESDDHHSAETPPMFALAATTGAGLCLMHMQGEPGNMQVAPSYHDLIGEVGGFLAKRVELALAAGVARENIWIDPGFGFGKTVEHNCELVRRIGELSSIAPVLMGLSRKSSLAKLSHNQDAKSDRLPESIAGAIAAWLNGAAVLRVHDVQATVCAIRVFGAMV